MRLNEKQRLAVESDKPFIVCIAPAGSGKTQTLTARVIRLMEKGADPNRILVLTFTRSAAAQMKERIRQETESRYIPDTRTIHSWAANLLRRFPSAIDRTARFSIYDEYDEEDLLRVCGEDLDAVHNPWKCRLATLRKRRNVTEEYGRRLQQGNAVDFDSLEELALRLLREDAEVQREVVGRYSHILLDEAQDSNAMQMAIFGGLRPVNFFIVGDFRQAIYKFRGANPEIILDRAASDDWQLIQLTENYRSTPAIVDAANLVAAGMTGSGVVEPMEGVRDEIDEDNPDSNASGVFFLDDLPDEATVIANLIRKQETGDWSDIAVLARQWRHLWPIRDALREMEIPVRYMGKKDDPWDTLDGRMIARAVSFWRNPQDLNIARWLDGWGSKGPRCGDHRRIRADVYRRRMSPLDVMIERDPTSTWRSFQGHRERWGPNPSTGSILLKILPVVFGRYDAEDCADLGKMAAALPDDVSTFKGFQDWWVSRKIQDRVKETEDEEGVMLATVHCAKGLEWPVVYLASCVDGIYPMNWEKPEEVEEDRRVLYVAVSRARDRLILSFPREYVLPWGPPVPAKPTPFLKGK